MKRFRFSLEKVLKLRTQEQEQAKRALAQAMAVEASARQALEDVRARLQQRASEAGALERAGLSVFEFANFRHYVAFLQGEEKRYAEELARAEQMTQKRRLALLEARRREKALEKLKERRLEQYQQESLRHEQKELDEYGNRQGLNRPPSEPDI